MQVTNGGVKKFRVRKEKDEGVSEDCVEGI